jgi:hypothetical protein
LNLVKTLQRAVLLLWLLALLTSAGVAPFCASCGPKVMDCCKGDPSGAVSMNQTPCCDFRMSVTAEPHPARMTSQDSGSLQDEAPQIATQAVGGSIASPDLPQLPASNESRASNPSPPLFLLHTSFLC